MVADQENIGIVFNSRICYSLPDITKPAVQIIDGILQVRAEYTFFVSYIINVGGVGKEYIRAEFPDNVRSRKNLP